MINMMQIFKITVVTLRVGTILSYFMKFWYNELSFPS